MNYWFNFYDFTRQFQAVTLCGPGSTEQKKKKRARVDAFPSFERSDIWNKEPSYEQFWDRQTDGGQILPARQINRPRRVGSPGDDSYIHALGNMSTNTHTHTEGKKYSVCKFLKTLALQGRAVEKDATRRHRECTLNEKQRRNKSLSFTHVSPSSCFCLRPRWKCSLWDCLSGPSFSCHW